MLGEIKPEPSSWLTFIAQVVSSLAWPVTLLACVVLLRRHLLAMVPLVRTVKYSDVEIHFGKELAEVKRTTSDADIPKEITVSQSSIWEGFVRLAETRPRSAIRGAWRQIETLLLSTAKGRSIEVAEAAESMPMVVGAILMNHGVLTVPQYELLHKLRSLFHEAEHAGPDTLQPDSATDYIGLALRLAAAIDPNALR